MQLGHALAAALAVALAALVLPTAAAESPAAPQVTDPQGDASEYNSEMALRQAQSACLLAWEAERACYAGGVWWADYGEPVGGVPAPAAMDVLSAAFEETPTALRVTLELASLDEAWTGAVRDGPRGQEGAMYTVRWFGDHQNGCMEDLYLLVGWGPAPISLYGNAQRGCDAPGEEHPWGGGCNGWWWCEIEVPYELEYGTPGRITWSIPRDALAQGDVGGKAIDPSAAAMRLTHDTWLWRMNAQTPVAYQRSAMGDMWDYAVDRTATGTSFEFETPREAWPAADPAARHAERPQGPDADPRLDILSLDVHETPEEIRLDVTLGQVDPAPAELFVWMAFEVGGGTVLDLRILDDGSGNYGGYAAYAASLPGMLNEFPIVAVPAEVQVRAGAPGTLSVAVNRADLPPIHEGQVSKLLGAATADHARGVHHLAEPAPGVRVWAETELAGSRAADYTWGTPMYRFLHDTPAEVFEGTIRVGDPSGDVALPTPVMTDPTVADRFDITYVQARSVSEDETHLTIGLRDLSRATVPDGYKGMFFGMGAQKGDGATMIGYYKAAGAPKGDFLCSPDITILSETQRDPTEAVWTIISGIVTAPPSDGESSGAGGPGAITFYVPHACFGDDVVENGELRLDRLAAGTFLVRDGANAVASGTVAQVDEIAPIEALALPVPARDEQLSPAAWYEAPFGLSHFWDMLGIGLAVVVGGTGAAMKLRRRKLDKRALADAKAREDREVYRVALARAVVSHADPAGDEVLGALRRRLGISEREHAIMELEARSEAGLAMSGLPAGTRFLGKYRVERQLGEGGFARTFLARDEKLARRVVLKIARWPSQEETRRALHEARVLARMDHPNIVKIHDVDEVADQLVMVLEHVPGGSLDARLASGPLPERDALALADDLLAGLDAAHAQGVVHRDVKPANVLLTRDGRAKLADFGIARGAPGAATVTGGSLAGNGAGTVLYMAPEQARGQAADARSDVYSAAAVLYEMLAGRPPLDLAGLSEFEARTAVIEERPRLPIAGVSAATNALLARALSKDPAKRPQDARAMREMLAPAPATQS